MSKRRTETKDLYINNLKHTVSSYIIFQIITPYCFFGFILIIVILKLFSTLSIIFAISHSGSMQNGITCEVLQLR